jgi:DNA-binding transcriptional ArsR family regulator
MGLISTSRLLKALADDSRLRILHLLEQEDLTGSDLMEILNMGQSRVSTHLNLLKEVGLVVDRREGRRAVYAIAGGPGATLLGQVMKENHGSILKPDAFKARTADSRPGPGPLTLTSRFFTPNSLMALPTRSAAT